RLPITTNALSELSDDAKKIDRVARYKLLSKRSWMQKITTKETPRDIIIPIDINLANDSNGISFLIDPNKTYVTGTINFKKGRYLHLSTDLLIIKLLEEAVKEVDGTDETTDAVQTVSLSAPEDVNELSAENEADPFITTPKPQWPDLILKSRALEQSYYSKTNKKASEQTPYPLVIDSSHIAQIAPMKQRRKMRSSETHYIDHPLVGLVVRITPLVKLLD
ncbi:MAG: hypothetical protein KAG18_06840, partial [Sinobacterium sp.]|nr:hypothetical protein [Sinobacterium sp.]